MAVIIVENLLRNFWQTIFLGNENVCWRQDRVHILFGLKLFAQSRCQQPKSNKRGFKFHNVHSVSEYRTDGLLVFVIPLRSVHCPVSKYIPNFLDSLLCVRLFQRFKCKQEIKSKSNVFFKIVVSSTLSSSNIYRPDAVC